MPQTGIEHLRTCAEMIDWIVARQMCEHLTGSCIIACHSSTASTEKTKLHSSAWEVLMPWYAGQSYAQEKPGTTLQQLLLELSQVAGKLNLPLYLLKINRQRNFYCRFCSRTDTDGYAKTGNILQRKSVLSWHCTSKRKNWQQA